MWCRRAVILSNPRRKLQWSGHQAWPTGRTPRLPTSAPSLPSGKERRATNGGRRQMRSLKAAASVAVTLGVALLATTLPADAADYPDHPIKMIVAYPPGGAT